MSAMFVSTPALAASVRYAVKSDDTNLVPIFIIAGIGALVLIGAIVVRMRSSKGEGGSTPDAGKPTNGQGGKHSGQPGQGRHSR